jgi:hypothetical protein
LWLEMAFLRVKKLPKRLMMPTQPVREGRSAHGNPFDLGLPSKSSF